MSPLASQLLVLGAVLYLLPYRVVVRPILLNRRAGKRTRWDLVRVLRVYFVALLAIGGGWLAFLINQATTTGPTVWTLPHGACALVLILAGMTCALIAEHLNQDHADEKYTVDQLEHTHNGPPGHEMDVV